MSIPLPALDHLVVLFLCALEIYREKRVGIRRVRGSRGHAHGAPIAPLRLRGRRVEEALELSSRRGGWSDQYTFIF
jgi:hypothetical protein